MAVVEYWVNGEKFCEFKKFIWRLEDKYLLFLEAIDTNTRAKAVYPVYQQVFDWSVHGGQATLTVFRKTKTGQRAYILTAQLRPPFLSFKRHYVVIQAAGDDDED